MAGYINTIQDMERLFYDSRYQGLLTPNDLQAPMDIRKDAGAVTSGVTGVFNAIFGAQAWVQLNMEANTFGVIPKSVHGRSGWRVITTRAVTLGTAGVAENAGLPAAVKPIFAEVSALPKTIPVVWNIHPVALVYVSATVLGELAWLPLTTVVLLMD